jgi:hypothetical protein
MQRRARVIFAGTAMAAILALTSVLTVSAAPVRFGSSLTPSIQPQPAQWCDEPNADPPHADCTWILNEGYSDAPGVPPNKAPKAGIIGRVRLMSCEPGSFRVQVARKVPGTSRYKVRKNGPRIEYQGDSEQCDDTDGHYDVERFAKSFSVLKGDRIAIRARQTGTLRCGGGGDSTLLFSGPLVAGGNARRPSDDSDCWLLIEWQYR